MIKQLISLILFFFCLNIGSGIPQDSLQIQYSIVGMHFHEDHDVIKIKVPPWMKSSDLILQIKRAVLWPGEPPPDKITYVYVFKETDQVGEESQTGAVYSPKKGFAWKLSSWEPTQMPAGIPRERDFEIYYDLIDRIIRDGSNFGDWKFRSAVAKEHSLTLSELDSIYVFVNIG